jgi:hypothetical protein
VLAQLSKSNIAVSETHHGTAEHPRPSWYLTDPSETNFQIVAVFFSRRNGNAQRTR